MEQHEIDTFIAMAQRQHGDNHKDPNYWVEAAMKMAYNLGYDHGERDVLAQIDPWEHEDDWPV